MSYRMSTETFRYTLRMVPWVIHQREELIRTLVEITDYRIEMKRELHKFRFFPSGLYGAKLLTCIKLLSYFGKLSVCPLESAEPNFAQHIE